MRRFRNVSFIAFIGVFLLAAPSMIGAVEAPEYGICDDWHCDCQGGPGGTQIYCEYYEWNACEDMHAYCRWLCGGDPAVDDCQDNYPIASGYCAC